MDGYRKAEILKYVDKARMHSLIDPEARVADTAILGDFVIVSKGAFIGEGVRIDGFTQIWEDVRIESNVVLESGVVLQRPVSAVGKATIFRPGSLIGAGAVIRHGVTIGEGAIIRPGSVVEHDIPPYAIVSGFPARAVGYVESISREVGSAWRLQATFPSSPATVPLGVGAVTLHRLKKVCDPRGDLSVGEFPLDIPFEPKRYFLVFNVPSENTRGEHAHRKCHQFLICVNGSCALVVDDGKSRCEIVLESRDMGVHLPPMTWGIQYKHSRDAVLLVFTSEYYDADDYIRDYGDFIALTAGER